MRETEKLVSDEEIVALFFQRDERAVEKTASKYGKLVYSVAFQILQDDSDCRECQNDAYLSLWKHIPPDQPKCFQAYLIKIIRNIALDRYREKSCQKRIPSEYMTSIDELCDYIGDASTPETDYDFVRLQEIINSFVKSLPERKKYIFVCRYYCCDPVPDIAKALKISESMVFKELAKIKKMLKTNIEKEGYFI